MLNESDRAIDTLPEATPLVSAPAGGFAANALRARLREAVSEVFAIDSENILPEDPRVSAIYTGRLLADSETTYAQLDARFAPLDHVATFSIVNNQQVVTALKGRIVVTPRQWWPNALLFALTVFSLFYIGSGFAGADPSLPPLAFLLSGWPYALGVILILGTHELAHYFAARYHKVAVTLPYFIPLPIPGTFGTLGAFIQLREPMRNRKVLLDVGAAGPLAGLIVAIPVLLIGLKTSPVLTSPLTDLLMFKVHAIDYGLEGNSILYALSKILVFGRFLPSGMHDVFINALAQAGWTGLLVTGLNLIPLGQLDGGHALFSLIGERARLLYIPFLMGLAILATFYQTWLLWIVLLLLLGRVYATPLDMITKLDMRRRIIAITALVAFVLVFMPIPGQEVAMHLW